MRGSSHPVWVRGLKQAVAQGKYGDVVRRTPCGCVDWNTWGAPRETSSRSRTPCGCVDWNVFFDSRLKLYFVAPRVGAWIETHLPFQEPIRLGSRTPCGCVDWNNQWNFVKSSSILSHPVWVRGLKPDVFVVKVPVASRTPCGCVDWNLSFVEYLMDTSCRTPCGCVDWNIVTHEYEDNLRTSHPVWVRGLKPISFPFSHRLDGVAPRVGAWIETRRR